MKKETKLNLCKSAKAPLHVILIPVTLLIAMFALGCNNGSNNSEKMKDTEEVIVKSGVFIDSPVQGLDYRTDTQSGVTNKDGRFYYMDGEMIHFSIGGITMGEVMASTMITPIDLVPDAIDEMHPTVTNMIRFMQTIDADNNPDNGITINKETSDELRGRNIDFYMPMENFEHNNDVEMFMDTFNEMYNNGIHRTMVSAVEAQEHMREYMLNMMQDQNSHINPNGNMYMMQ